MRKKLILNLQMNKMKWTFFPSQVIPSQPFLGSQVLSVSEYENAAELISVRHISFSPYALQFEQLSSS